MKLLKSSFWLHSIFYTLLQRFTLFFFGAVSYMLVVRAFGEDKASMAVWALYITTITIFETIKQGLLRNPTIKFLGQAEYADKKREVQSSALAINIGFSLITILFVLVWGNGLAAMLKSPALAPLLKWSIIFVSLLVPFNHYEVLLQAHYQFQKIFVAYVVRQGILFGGIVCLFFFFRSHFTLLNLVMLQIISLLAGAIILYSGTAAYRLRGFHYDATIVRRMFHFGKYIFGTNLFANIARNLDHFVTANVLSADAGKIFVANYNAAARINNMMDVPSLAAADVLFPKNVETLEKDGLGKVKYYFERMIGTILAVIVPISLFIFIFPKFVLFIITGPEYYGAITILQITILANIVRPLGYQFGSTLDAVGKPRVNFLANALTMTVGLILTWQGLTHFGGMGAAYALAVSNLFSLLIMIFILKKFIYLEVSNIPRYMLQSYKDMFGMYRKIIRKLRTK